MDLFLAVIRELHVSATLLDRMSRLCWDSIARSHQARNVGNASRDLVGASRGTSTCSFQKFYRY